MSTRRIIQAFDAWRAAGEPMVLATVVETRGSTYSKAGHRILIAGNGDYQGLVSGGCLEGDLAERARDVLRTGAGVCVTYDMRDGVDDLWGLGVGCNGLIRVFLQPLEAAHDYQPFTAIRDHLRDNRAAVVATVVAGARDELPVGATLIWTAGSADAGCFGLSAAVAGPLLVRCAAAHRTGMPLLIAGEGEGEGEGESEGGAGHTDARVTRILYAPLVPVPRLLVLGAGLDAVPVVSMAVELGWDVTVADHRPAYLSRGGFDGANEVLEVSPYTLTTQIDPKRFDAIVVMSHHLVSDREYLRQLANVDVAYVGVLGPPARRARLLEELGDAAGDLPSRLKGPVGLDIGADTPESIALSIMAELHAVLRGREAVPLQDAAPLHRKRARCSSS